MRHGWRWFLLGALCLSAVASLVLPGTAAAFGNGDARWVSYYSSPSIRARWEPFCQGGGGSHWLLTALVVPACGPTGSTPIYLPNGGGPTPGFQCVELTERYFWVAKGWNPINSTNGAQVVKNYAAAHGLPVIANGTSGQAPMVGDVLSFSSNPSFSDTGHAAVVTAASVNRSGNGSITMVGENQSNGTASSVTLGVSAWSVNPRTWDSALPYVDWLHVGSILVARLSGDWDGNGTSTPGLVYIQNNALVWYLRNSNTTGVADITFSYGNPGDIPIAGNWDGVGGDTPGVVRSSGMGNGSGLGWYLRNYNSTGVANIAFSYGNEPMAPITGNWDGVGGDTPGAVNSSGPGSTLTWYLRNYNSTGVANITFQYGNDPMVPIAGNWDGVGGDTPGAVSTPGPGAVLTWYLRNYNSTGVANITFGYGNR